MDNKALNYGKNDPEKHELSPAVAEKYELTHLMHPTKAILSEAYGRREVDFRTMTLAEADELVGMEVKDASGKVIPFPYLKLKAVPAKKTGPTT